ncbi:hypothetical protein [Fluviibacter sp.]
MPTRIEADDVIALLKKRATFEEIARTRSIAPSRTQRAGRHCEVTDAATTRCLD